MCGIFDITQCIRDLLPWWLPYAWWGFVAILGLGFLAWLKQTFGWIAVIALWTIIAVGGGVFVDRHFSKQLNAVVVQQPVKVKPVFPRTIWDDLPPLTLSGD